jgi:hypothetical protein
MSKINENRGTGHEKRAGGPRTRLRRPKRGCTVTNRISARCLTCGKPAPGARACGRRTFCKWHCPCAGTLRERVEAAYDELIEREMAKTDLSS